MWRILEDKSWNEKFVQEISVGKKIGLKHLIWKMQCDESSLEKGETVRKNFPRWAVVWAKTEMNPQLLSILLNLTLEFCQGLHWKIF